MQPVADRAAVYAGLLRGQTRITGSPVAAIGLRAGPLDSLAVRGPPRPFVAHTHCEPARRNHREPALYAVRATTCKENDKQLTFPARYGGHRSEGKFLGRRHFEMWNALLHKADVQRHLCWHDLRHTCGTALLGGYFGRKWRLEEIQQMLGHAEVTTTERYAHALQQTLNDAARATAGDIGGDDQ